MIRMTGRGLIALALAAVMCPATSFAYREVEDFEALPDGGFNNPVFQHDIQPGDFQLPGRDLWEFVDTMSISPTHSLFMSPATDFITFVVPAGEVVDYAEVYLASVVSQSDLTRATVEFIGLDGGGSPLTISDQSTLDGEWTFASTAGAGFSEITEIRLTSNKEGTFDDVAINITPEPATLCLCAFGLTGLLLRRRSRRAR